METKSISVTVGKPLWKAISTVAMEEDKTLGEVLVPVLEREFGGRIQSPVSSRFKVDSKVIEKAAARPEPVSEPLKVVVESKPKVDQSSCKHKFLGTRHCVICGWIPPMKL